MAWVYLATTLILSGTVHASELDGSWDTKSITCDGKTREIPAAKAAMMTFAEGAVITTTADMNQTRGTFSISGNQVTIKAEAAGATTGNDFLEPAKILAFAVSDDGLILYDVYGAEGPWPHATLFFTRHQD